MKKIILYLIVSFGIVSCSSIKKDEKNTMPNIVLILADDLGYGDLTCYNKDSKIPTPNIDELASNGLRFTDAHSPSAVCTPTRYGILTGRYCWRTRLKSGVAWTYEKDLIDRERITLAKLLKDNGYSTAMVGKWHLGWEWPYKEGFNPDSMNINVYRKKDRFLLEQNLDLTKPLKGGPIGAGFDYQFGVDVPNFPPYCFF